MLDDIEDAKFCINCVTENALKKLIHRKGKSIDTCYFCATKFATSLEVTDKEFSNALNAFVRLYHDEWEYNTHVGGDNSPSSLLWSDASIFNLPKIQDIDTFHEAVEYCVNWDTDLHLYNEGYMSSIESDSFSSYNSLVPNIKRQKYASVYKEVSEIVDLAVEHLQSSISKLSLFRARIGIDKIIYPEFASSNKTVYVPHSDKDLGSPPYEKTSGGRINRQHFSFLYLAEDIDTAIHEVKPSPGDIVSVGQFSQNNDLNIIDFSKLCLSDFWNSDDDLDRYGVLYKISKALSRPLGESDRHNYVFTQLVSEEILRRGFDGICFKSSLTDKLNYTIFDPALFQFCHDSSKAYNTKKAKITFETV